MEKEDLKEEKIPEQQQSLPGSQHKLDPQPEIIRDDYRGSDKLLGKTALITGGDSGIGQSVAVHYAREGANVAIIYLEEDEDARQTEKLVEREGRKFLAMKGDIGDRTFCQKCVERVIETFGDLNVLVNNAGEQHTTKGFEELDLDVTEKTFQTNILSM